MTRLAQHIEIVFLDRHVQRRAFFLPVGDQRIQPARVQYRAGQNMRAHFGPFFQNHNVQVGVQLFQTDGRRQASRTGPNDHHVVFHRFAFNLGHRGLLS